MELGRRELIAGASAAGLAGVLLPGLANGQVTKAPGDLYQVDDPKTIMDAARAILKEDAIAVFVTVDEHGMPRARPVGVRDPEGDDWTMWIGTRRGSRKTRQVQANPNATLHFGFDDVAGNYQNAFYASFMGKAFVHTDEATLAVNRPPEAMRKQLWPDFPNDFAAIRFVPQRLEVMGKGIMPSEDIWQPQGVTLG